MYTQRTLQIVIQETDLLLWSETFLQSCRSRNLSPGTYKFYTKKLGMFIQHCQTSGVTDITQLTPVFIRHYLSYLQEQGHNPGGVHAAYRTIKAFLRWYEYEAEPEGWKNPIAKVKGPRVPDELLDPIDGSDVEMLITTCDKSTLCGLRDRAIFQMLFDTGARAQEFLDLRIDDVNLFIGEVVIRRGKGGKARIVYVGRATRKSLRAYLKQRQDNLAFLWVSCGTGECLSYDGLRSLLSRRSELAGITRKITLHSFRRGFAITMLRSGVDVFSIKELMGHADLKVLQRYLKLTSIDLKAAHILGQPVDGGGRRRSS